MERHHNSLNEINFNGNINPANSQDQVADNSVRNENQPLNMALAEDEDLPETDF